MSSFIENLINRKFDLSEEILSINDLFERGTYYDPSLKDIVSQRFTKWKHRSNFIRLSQMFDKMGINNIISRAKVGSIKIDKFIYFVECIYNLLSDLEQNSIREFNRNTKQAIYQNINNVLNQLNYSIKYFNNEDYFKVIENDWKVSCAADIIKDRYDLGEKIYLYGHYSMKGKLYDKADILCRLYKVFEDGNATKLKACHYSTLVNDIGFLADKLDVRHAPDNKEKILLSGLTKEEQENWYDELFTLYLDMLILCDHIDKRKDIKELSTKLVNIQV